MIFDIHCHILPGVDDGAKTAGSTKRMLKMASEEGIDAIVATPHFTCGMDVEKVQEIKDLYVAVRKWWKQKEPSKELYLGNELMYSEGLVQALEEGIAMTMNDTRYVLVEFPVYVELTYVQKAIQRLQYAGYIPIIAHIERYKYLQDRKKIQELVDMKVYIQVNVSSIIGSHGLMTQHRIMSYIKGGLVHFIATDAHGSKARPPEIKQCVQYLEKKLGAAKVHQILEENPAKMLRGEELNG